MARTNSPKPFTVFVATLTACGLLVAVAVATPSQAGVPECRKKAAKIVGKFAQKRAKQIINCRLNDECGPDNLAAKRERLREDLRGRLQTKCSDVDGSELGMGGICPDPTGVCRHDLSDAAGVIECILCMSGETLEHLIDVVHGDAVPVAERCGGCVGSRCAPDAFCEPPAGVCNDAFDLGMCSEVPEACPQIFEPVCGCDGTTYGNDCERRKARVGARHDGACKARCDDADVCPNGTFCEGLPGLCGIVADGVCESIPDVCTEQFDPVCGCDGTTYGNDCQRRAAGVRLHHQGRCVTYCGNLFPFDPGIGPDGQPILPPIETCKEGQYCEHEPGICRNFGGPGECIDLPQGCPDVVDPVCGCDGVTYANDCDRMSAGISKLHDGECERRCGGFAGIPCAHAGQVCDLPPGTCNFADLQGSCVDKPEVCPDNFDPVCGCDGETYSNNCERLGIGVSLHHHGECRQGCVPGDDTCGGNEVCVPPHGQCGSPGECVATPQICPLGIDATSPFPLFAVCGCDGATYTNACEAARNGVGVAHDGACGGEFECLTDADCPQGHVCAPPPGLCLIWAAPAGPVLPLICQPVPDDCGDEHSEPVCGCDGQNYESHCEALRSGGGFGYPGSCFDFPLQ